MSYSLHKREMKILFTKTNSSSTVDLDDIIDINTTAMYNNSGCTINSNNIVLQTGYYLWKRRYQQTNYSSTIHRLL